MKKISHVLGAFAACAALLASCATKAPPPPPEEAPAPAGTPEEGADPEEPPAPPPAEAPEEAGEPEAGPQEEAPEEAADEPPPRPPLLTELATVEFSGRGIKYEVENMLLSKFIVMQDRDASGGYCARLEEESSTAQIKVRFPPGTYECMVMEKAEDNAHSAFYVYLDETPHRMYPSNPPLGMWELTYRTPVYFTLEEPRTILVTLCANSEAKLGSTGMSLDYIQFVQTEAR